MLSPSQLEQFARDGFVAGSQILDAAQIQTLRDEMERVIAQRDGLEKPPVSLSNFGSESAPVWQIVNIWHASAAFAALAENPLIAHEAAQLTGARELRLFHDQIQYKPAQKGGVNMWHQDSPYWPILQPKTSEITAWVALDDVDLENGCMQMVPGSHMWGENLEFLHSLGKNFEAMPDEFEGRKIEVVATPVKAGQVHFHHPLTWHGSNANTSGRPCRAVALHYMTEQTVFDASRNHIMKPLAKVQDGQKIEGQAFPLIWSAN